MNYVQLRLFLVISINCSLQSLYGVCVHETFRLYMVIHYRCDDKAVPLHYKTQPIVAFDIMFSAL